MSTQVFDSLAERRRSSSSAQELANAVTHGVGILLALIGAVPLVAARPVSVEMGVATLVYAVTLVSVYLLSTLSHVVRAMPARGRLRAWDQGMIYFLIAGTYTPFVAAYLSPTLMRTMLALLWTYATIGWYSKVVVRHRVDALATWSYVLLGWVPALCFLGRVPPEVLAWVAAGGVSYTLGTIFLKLDHWHVFFHAIWHVFVLAGSACHYYAIYRFLAVG